MNSPFMVMGVGGYRSVGSFWSGFWFLERGVGFTEFEVDCGCQT
jgi:hypothetical protein